MSIYEEADIVSCYEKRRSSGERVPLRAAFKSRCLYAGLRNGPLITQITLITQSPFNLRNLRTKLLNLLTEGDFPFDDLILPFNDLILPFDDLILPFDDLILPFDDLILPFDDLILPFDDLILPFDDLILPFDDLILPFDDLILPFDDLILPFDDLILPFKKSV